MSQTRLSSITFNFIHEGRYNYKVEFLLEHKRYFNVSYITQQNKDRILHQGIVPEGQAMDEEYATKLLRDFPNNP